MYAFGIGAILFPRCPNKKFTNVYSGRDKYWESNRGKSGF